MLGIHHHHGAARVSEVVVQIIAPDSVLYSLDRGFTLTEFEAGELYAVPDFVAEGMIKRGWAKIAEAPPVEGPEEDHKKGKRREK